MALDNMAYKASATAITATAGIASNLLSINDDGSKHVLALGTGSFLSTPSVTYTASAPKASVQSPSGYTQQRLNIALKTPKTLANDKLIVNMGRVELSTDVETTTAEIDEMRRLLAQFITSSASDNFFHSMSLS
jgi:hypothetical protein